MQRVEIRIEGHLDADWANWLDGFDLNLTDQGETVLTGVVADQSALYGLMAKLRDLGARIIAIHIGDPYQ